MKIASVRSWFLCYAAFPLLVLGVYIISRGTQVALPTAPGDEFGSVSFAGDDSGNPAVSKAATLFVRGWVIDKLGPWPVANVVVSVDGINVGVATLSAARGWSFQMPAAALPPGRHLVTAKAIGRTRPESLGEGKTIEVTTQGGKEIGSLDIARDANGNGVIAKGGILLVAGWAADTIAGAPVGSVAIFVDGQNVGAAALNIARPDVVSSTGRGDYVRSGWSFQLSTANLSAGEHSVAATVSGPSGSVSLPAKRIIVR